MLGLDLPLSVRGYRRVVLPEENRAPADAIVIPGVALARGGRARGLLRNRVAMATLLLEEGLAPRLLVSGGKPRGDTTEAERMLALAVALGVRPEQVLLESRAASTRENALGAAALLAEHGLGSALLVSDRMHLVYALPVFQEAFAGRGLALRWTSVDYGLLRRRGLFSGWL